MVRTEYPGLLKHDPALRAAADSLARRTRELSQFIVEVLGVTTIESPFKGKVTYHDSCHLLRGLGESASPRALLRGVPGVELVELPGAGHVPMYDDPDAVARAILEVTGRRSDARAVAQ